LEGGRGKVKNLSTNGQNGNSNRKGLWGIGTFPLWSKQIQFGGGGGGIKQRKEQRG